VARAVARSIGILLLLAVILASGALLYIGRAGYLAAKTIHQVLAENRELKQAITNLTHEDLVGYAKVLQQQEVNGRVVTTVLFVETDRSDPGRRVLEKEFTLDGDVIHFDAVIVKFGAQMVMDGRERALFLWRRIYGENTPPESGTPIEQPGKEPQRYRGWLAKLPLDERQMFWDAIWGLANDPDRLRQHGIRALYGSAVYFRVQPGRIYRFKIDANGQFFPEVTPDL
jgi:hypothetical protein